MKKFTLFKVYDARKAVAKYIPEGNQKNYKFKKLNNKQKETLVLSKKSFERLQEEADDKLVLLGRISKRQLRYKDYDDYDELVEKKNEKKIYGKATLVLTNGEEKYYDVRENANRHVYGYAWLGDNTFLKVITLNPLWFLLPLFIILLCFLFKGCPNDYVPVNVFDTPSEITEEKTEDVKQYPLCYYVPFNEETILNSEKQTLKLMNVKENEGTFYISYQVFINGNLQRLAVKDGVFHIASSTDKNNTSSTGLLAPNKQILLNLWSGLDKGNYEVTIVATDYDYDIISDLQLNGNAYSNKKKAALQEKATMPVTHTLKTNLIVEK